MKPPSYAEIKFSVYEIDETLPKILHSDFGWIEKRQMIDGLFWDEWINDSLWIDRWIDIKNENFLMIKELGALIRFALNFVLSLSRISRRRTCSRFSTPAAF